MDYSRQDSLCDGINKALHHTICILPSFPAHTDLSLAATGESAKQKATILQWEGKSSSMDTSISAVGEQPLLRTGQLIYGNPPQPILFPPPRV